MLPESKNPIGYTKKELQKICKERKITLRDFNKAFGVNTCGIDKNGEILYYQCDVERTLYDLGHKDGIWHEWD